MECAPDGGQYQARTTAFSLISPSRVSALVQKRTNMGVAGMSAMCQKRTHALQHDHCKKKDRLAAVSPKPNQGACGASPNRVCLIRRLRWQRPSASCASRADPTRRGRWRREGGRQGRPVGFVSESNSNSGRATSVHHQPFLTRSPHTR